MMAVKNYKIEDFDLTLAEIPSGQFLNSQQAIYEIINSFCCRYLNRCIGIRYYTLVVYKRRICVLPLYSIVRRYSTFGYNNNPGSIILYSSKV